MLSDDDSFHSAHDSKDSTDSSSNTSFCSMPDTLGDFVFQSFSQSANHFLNICHINAQSIPSHYSDLVEAFTGANVHAVLISESWLKPHLLSTTYPLSGFILVRNDRIGRGGGGVAIYLRSEFPFKILASSVSTSSASAEYLFLEISVKGVKALLGVVYCPPAVDYFMDLELVLESLGSEYAHHVIMGDFNTDLIRHSPRSRKLLHVVEAVGLHVLPLKATHCNITGEDTWLDLILTSTPSLVSAHGQSPAPGFSHHDLIFLSYILKPPKPVPKVLRMRCFGRMDGEKLLKDASEINWDHLMAVPTVHEKVSVLNQTILSLYDVQAPIKKVKLKRPPAPPEGCCWLLAYQRDTSCYET